MILAHAPAGYLVSKILLAQFRLEYSSSKQLMILGILGSVFPDLDMLYFYLIDSRQHGHHSYWTHIPYYWALLLCIGYSIAAIFRSRILVAATTIFVGCALLHLLLDTFAGGGIKWLHPFSNQYTNIFSIPSRYSHWVWNYVFHWTAIVELALTVSAIAMYRTTRRLY